MYNQLAHIDLAVYMGGFAHIEQFFYVNIADEFALDDGIFATDFSFNMSAWPNDDFGGAVQFAFYLAVHADVAVGFNGTLYYGALREAVERIGGRSAGSARLTGIFFTVAKHKRCF